MGNALTHINLCVFQSAIHKDWPVKKSANFFSIFGGCFNLVLCYVMLPYFLSKILGYIQNIWVKSYDPLCSLLCCVMLSYDFLSKILCPVMLCLWWHEIKSKILWSVMLVLFVSKILCSVMNLTIAIMYMISAKTS